MSILTFAISTEFFLLIAFAILIMLHLRNGYSKPEPQNVKEDLMKIKKQIMD